MSKSAFPARGGALSKFDRAAVMARAWAIFRETYRYPSIPFRSIGRPCFAWALKTAWHEIKEAARFAAIPAEIKAERVAFLREAIEFEKYNDCYPQMVRNIARMQTEIARLSI